MVVTIDGPVASGKSTVAKRLASELGFYYLYTGLLYRAIAYVLVHHKGYSDQELKAPLQADLDDILKDGRLDYSYEANEPAVYFDGENITPYLKTREIDGWSSLSSADPRVRHAIFEMQVRIGKLYNVVADGRDTGSVVFPDALCKFYLTAEPRVRALRWQQDQAKAGVSYTLDECERIVNERDQRDITRVHSPLIQAVGAHRIDNSNLSIDETVAMMKRLVVAARQA
ncbi:TPA: (d)CMP kinase [Candidatus Dependentiae bacterium]|nr:(d)CMP kinase [Candidatus Dependentiae bacterium]